MQNTDLIYKLHNKKYVIKLNNNIQINTFDVRRNDICIRNVLFSREDNPVKITYLPYYGGARGQTLQITETNDGKIMTQILDMPYQEMSTEPIPFEVEYPPLPDKYESEYGKHIRNINQNALKILKFQDELKKEGRLNKDDEDQYNTSVDALNISADKLSKLHEQDDDYDFDDRSTGLSAWFDRKKSSYNKDDNKKKVNKKEDDKKKEDEEKRKEEEKRKKEEEKRKQQEKEQEENEKEEAENGDGETISINLPPEDAAVAEAKPIGLAIAGVGGVAASKPIATAVVGPGGLAIARPVATAIAGVSPDEALVPIYPEGYLKPNKSPKEGSKEASKQDYINKLIEKYHIA